ncbi:uncharacterized protein J7T54_007163 [Emericellopsis cladophorae]|uniref:L-asparaginase II n=1 Tax=Emericellopsis cladophorae TaxID=2686198 RepID=A0A9P9Y9K8_9HYPO|nr:uncharacterized protein J7T54_007163 [Emericellopsis cladophorae]KAI6785520.1 hypothetical protein J7T54_007163 [Emericellopsis cladophorae]
MTRTTYGDNLVVTDRGGVVENTHEIHAAVTDADGRLLFYVGNPHRITLIRSAAKPMQALAVVETGGADQSSFDSVDLALMCASHSSEERHVQRARQMLVKVGATEDDLRCGGQPSITPQVTEGWWRDGVTPTAVYNCCSGKHAGMLAGAKALGAPLTDYHLHDHPIQQRVKRAVEEVARLPPSEIIWGIDGCNMPAPAYPLISLSHSYALFAKASSDLGRDAATTERERWMGRIYDAMARHPEQVGGDGRFCTMLMEAFEGRLIGKLGADACYAIGVKESEETRRLGARGALGLAVKVGDGNYSILYAVLAHLLEQLRIGSSGEREALKAFHELKMVNSVGVQTGTVNFQYKLHSVL